MHIIYSQLRSVSLSLLAAPSQLMGIVLEHDVTQVYGVDKAARKRLVRREIEVINVLLLGRNSNAINSSFW